MQRFITDKRTGIQYELIGDYYYPCLTVENEEPPMLTKYGRMRERYLREHKRVLYFNLLTSGKLYEHLAEIDTSACNMAKYLIKEMARKQGVTEQLKAEDMMKWVGLMNNIGACVDEIVLNDIVYVKQSERAKKPLNTVFQEICRHEMLGDFSADNYLNLENLQKSS